MGLREKVTITLVIIALIQIACIHCMPRTPRKASLKRYQDVLKPVLTSYSPARLNKPPKQTFGKTAQNGRISQNSFSKKSLYETYNFPENEYPLDNSPRDPFRIGMNFNENTLQKARNLQSSAINDLKKEMKMKRKLLSNKQVNNENTRLKIDMSSIKSVLNSDPIRLLDSETFPEVQYPLNSMDTWGPNYWNYLPFTPEKSLHRFEQQTFNPKAKEDVIKPFTRLTKAKASKYLQSYDKLKEQRSTTTENSKRSNVGQKGLNFTKTVTCERVSENFITAGLVSNIPSNSTEMKKALTLSTKITTSSENTCPVTENPYDPMPIPYKVIEANTENICPAHDPENKTKELQDVDNSVIDQTLQLIQEILFNDDTSSTVIPGNYSKEIDKNMNTFNYTVVSAYEDISTTLMDSAKSCTVSPTEELSQEVSDDAPVGNLRNNMTSLPAELIPENTTTASGPLNVKMPLPFSEPITYEELTNALSPGPTPLPSGNAVPGSTSIIIIPFNNNAVGKSQSHMLGTSPDTPIIVYLPSTQSSDNPSQPSPFNQIVFSAVDRPIPNNELYNVLSNMVPLQNDNPFSTTLVSELLNSNSDIVSSLPIHETLPTNSICCNESSPSSMREKPVSDILIDKSLTDDATFITKTCEENCSEKLTEAGDLLVVNTLPPISDFEHPLFDFSGSDFTSLTHGPYNNILHNELPIIARETDSDQQILSVSSKDLFIPAQNVTSQILHKTTSIDSVSKDSLPKIQNDVPPMQNKNFSSVTPTDSIEILKTSTLLSESIPNLQEPVDTLTESLPQPIDKILLSTPLIETSTAELPQSKESSRSPTLFFETLTDKLPILMDNTTDSVPQHLGNTPSPPILNSSPMMTDMTLKTELYKIREILDKMLSTETTTYSQPPPIENTLLPISDSDSLLLLISEAPTDSLPVPAVDKTHLPLPASDNPFDSLRQMHETLPLTSVYRTPTEILLLPGNKLVIPNKLLVTDTLSLLIDDTVLPVSETSANNKPYLLDQLVTPLSDAVTSRTKNTPDNGLSHKMDDLLLKMDLKFPDIYEVCSGDLPLSVDDLPTKVHPEHTRDPGVSTNDLPMQAVETLTPVSEVNVSNLPKPTDKLLLPVDVVLEGVSPDDPTVIVKTLMSGSTDKLLQDFPSSKVPSDNLMMPRQTMNVFKLPIHETFPDGQFKEISFKGPPPKYHLSISVQKLIPDLSLSDVLTNEPSLKDDSLSLVIDKNMEYPYSIADTKDLPLVVEYSLSPENDVTLHSLVTGIPSAVSLSTNPDELQSTNLDKIIDEFLSESTFYELPHDNLPLPKDKMLSLTDNTPNHLSLPINKTLSISKLPITKALLKNVLSDITKIGLLSIVAKDIPVTPHSLLDKTLDYVDVKSPLSETKEIPLRSVQKIFPNSEHTENLIGYVPYSQIPEDTSIKYLPSELLLSMDEMQKDQPYVPTDDVEDHDKNKTQSLHNYTHDLPVPIDKVFSPKDTTKRPPSSKLPITKALLENFLTYINTRGFSVPEAQSLPVKSPLVLDKTLYYIESPISHITENSQSQPVVKILPNTSLSDHPTENELFSTKATLPLPKDKTFSVLQSLDIPTELSPPKDNIRPNKPIISMYDKEQDEIDNPSFDNLTDDLSSASPTEGIFSLSKDTPYDLPNFKTQSSSKLPITKALLENVLSDINTIGSTLLAAEAIPVAPRSQLDKTLNFLKSPVSDMTEKNSAIETPVISMYGKEPDEIENPSSENLTDDLSSASPMEGILSLTKDTPNDLPNFKTQSSSKLPITKALLENVLSDINTKGSTFPVAEALPVAPQSQLDKTLYFLESPVSHMTKKSSAIDKPVISIYDKEQDEIENPSSEHLTDVLSSASPMEGILSFSKDTPNDLPNFKPQSSSKLPITKALLENVLSDISTKGSSFSVADALPVAPPSQLKKTLHFLESPVSDMTEKSSVTETPIVSMYDREPYEIENPSSENHTDYISSASPMEGILSLSKDTPNDLPNLKTQSSSKLPITKALLENVLSDINTRGSSFPVAEALPMAPRSQLDKTLHFLESPVSDMTEKSSVIETPVISMYGKEPDEIENPSSENLTDDLSSASPMEGILSLSKDTPNDPPNFKTQSSSKLPITKALLENVLSDINTKGFKFPVAEALPVAPQSQLDKTLHFLESPVSDMTEKSSVIETPVISMYGKEPNEIENPSSENLTDDLSSVSPMEGIFSISKDTSSDLSNIKTPSSSKLPITKALLENVLSDVSTKGSSFPVAEALPVATRSQLHKSLHFLESPVSDMTEKSSVIETPVISMYGKEPNEIENPSSENLTDDLSSVSPMEGIFSISKDTSSDLSNIKTPSSSKLPITKALLENVLSDISTKGFSLPLAKALPVAPRSQLDKTLNFLEFPVSDMTENSSVIETPVISLYGKEPYEIENPSSENLTDDLSSASPMEGILSFSKDTPNDLPNFKPQSSSKLPITKALLENVLSDINTKGFKFPVAEVLPVAPQSQLDKTLHFLESPVSDMTEKSSVTETPIVSMYDREPYEIENPSSENHTDDISSASPMEGILSLSKDTPNDLPNLKTQSSSKLPITKALLENVLSDISKKGSSFPVAEALPVATRSQLHKSLHFLESPVSDMTEKSSVIETPVISMYGKEPNEIENPSSENLTDDLSSVSPMEGIFSISKDTSSDLSNIKTPSSSKLPITKALLENVLSDISTKGSSFPVAEALPVATRSQLHKSLHFLESPVSDMTEKSSVIETPVISMYGKEPNEIENPSSEHLTDDLSSVSPMEGIFSISKDTSSDLSNIKTPSSSKLPINKALLENVLSDISTKGFSLPLAKALPVAPRSQLDKTLNFLEFPVSDMTEKSSVIETPVISMYGKEPYEIENPSSENLTDDLSSASPMEGILSFSKDTPNDLPNFKTQSSSKLPITKALLENVLSDISTKGSSFSVADALPVAPPSQLKKTLHFLESPVSDMTEKSSVTETPIVSMYDRELYEIENPSSENHTDYISSASPMEGILSLSKDTPNDLPNLKTQSSSKLPITKALLENVLSDINTRGSSFPVAEALPMAPRSQLDKTLHFLESPVSDMTEKSSVIETPVISMYGKEPDEIENPSSENLTDDLSSASPMEGILSLSKDTPNDPPNFKTQSSSKLPITKALLENVLSDINTKGFKFPVAEALPVAPQSQLDKTLHFLESPVSDVTEKSSVTETPIVSMYDREPYEIENPSSENHTDDISSASPMEGILSVSKDTPNDLPNLKTQSSSKLPITKALLENVLSDISKKGSSFPVAEALPVATRSQLHKSLHFLESPVSDMTEKSSVIETPVISMYGKEPNEIENPSSEHLTDDLSSVSPMEGIFSISKDTSSDLSNIKTPSSSKLPITKALLENVLSDINTRGSSFPVAEALPVATRSQLDKTLHFLESPVSDMTEKSSVIETPVISMYGKEPDEIENPSSENLTDDLSSASPMEGILSLSKDTPNDLPNLKTQSSSKLPITKALLENVLSDINTKGFKFPVAKALPVAPQSQLDKTLHFLESPVSDMTEKSSVTETPIVSMYDREPYEIENPSSENHTDDISSASPMEGILSLSKDTPNDLPNLKTQSSSKLPITKALLENVLSDINTRGSSFPVAEALPMAPRSQLDKTLHFLESPVSDMTEKSSVIETPVISMYGKEPDEIENPSSENLTDDLSSASPMEGILSLSKDTPNDPPNFKTQSSSKLPITKALLENVLSDINTKGFKFPVAAALPVAPQSQLDKTLHFLESPVSDVTEKSSVTETPIVSMYDREPYEIENPSSENHTDDISSASPMEGILSLSKDTPNDLPNLKTQSSSKLPITKALLENVLSDISKKGSSFPVAEALPVATRSQLHKSLHFLESPVSDMTEKSSVIETPVISMYGKEPNEIENPSSEHLTDDLSSVSPMEGIFSISKDTSSDLSNIKTPSSSKLPITKALLENVLSDINTRGSSFPVAEALPMAPRSQLDKTLHFLESPVSDMTEKSSVIETPVISMYGKEPDEIENPSSENLTDDLSSASPMEGILSLSKDTPNDLPNFKTQSSSKLPITKALLENVLSDISTKGSSFPVADALPVAPPSQLKKTLHFLESPVSDMTEKSSVTETPIVSMYDREPYEIENPSSENHTDDISSASPMEGILSLSKDTPNDLPNLKTQSSSKLPITKALLENVLSDINTRGSSFPVAEALPMAPRSQLDKTLHFLESPVSDMTEKSSVIETPVISMYGKEPDEIENPSSENLTDDLSSASPMEGILSLSKDTPNDPPNFKTQSSSKLPITKALLENVLSDINTKGFKFPVAEALPVAPQSQLDKTLHFLESPVSDVTEKSSVTETPIVSMYDREPYEIENPSSENHTDDISSASPMEGILSLSKDTPNDLPNLKTQSSSKLPITKALLENVLSDISKKGSSFPVAEALPVATRSQLHKSLHFLESPVSDMTEKSSVIETPVISMYGKEPNEIENPSSEHLTDDLSSVSPMEGIFSISKDTSSDLSNIKKPSSSKLPITKALLENVLSDISTKGSSFPVADAFPVAPPSQLKKTLHFLESPVSDMTEKSSVTETPIVSMYDREPYEIENPSSENHTDDISSASPMEGILSLSKDTPNDLPNLKTQSSSKLPITKALLENVLSDISTKGSSFPVADALPVAPPSQLKKTLHFLESPVSDMTEKSSVTETPIVSMYDREPYEIENPSSENHTDDISSASPMEGILSLSKDTPNDLSNIKTQSSSKLPITKALLENVLSDINTKGFSLPVAKALPMAPRSQLDKTLNFLEFPVSDMTEKSSVIETPVISMYGKEPNVIENLSSEHLTDDLSSASPMEGILSFSKDTPNDLQNFKTQSSSKLPITKALLENVLSDISTKGSSFPVAEALPVATRSQLHKPLHFLESPVSDMTEKSSVIETPFLSMYGKEPNEIENPSSEHLTDDLSSVSPMEGIFSISKDTSSDLSNIKTPSSSKLPITKALLENVLSDISTKGFSLPVAKALPVATRSQLDKSLHFLESPVSEMTGKSSVIETPVISMYGKEPDEIENPSSENLTDVLSSASPMEGILSFSKDMPNDLSNIKTPSSSKLPITKALLENVLLDISTKGSSFPVAETLPVAPHSQLDKTLNFLESPVSDMTEKSSVFETPVISMYGKEPDEIENTSSEHLTDDLSSVASPMEGILSFSKDMPNDLQNFKSQSSSKLLITKALLENVLSDINTRGSSFPVAEALTMAPRSQLDKTLNFLEFPVSEMTEKSSVIETPVISMYDREQDEIENLSSENLTDDLSSVSPMEGIFSISKDTSSDLSNIKTPSSSKLPITKALLENVLLDISTKGSSFPVAETLPVAPRSQLDKTLNFLESPVSDMTEKSSVIETPVISMYDREPDEIENPSSEHLTDDLSSVSPMEGIFSISKDTSSDLSNIKTPSSSKLPITKALLENVLSDINTKGFSLPVAKALPVAPRSQLDKTLNFLESPVSDMTEKSSVFETPVISMYGKEPDEIENTSSEHLTDVLSSASPMEGILSFSKDMPNDLQNFKSQSSSKLLITKALLENVLSDISAKGSSFPVAEALPVAPRSQLHKSLHFLESPVSDMTEKSSVIETPVISMYDREPDEIENPSSEHLTDDLSSVSPMEGIFSISKDTSSDLSNIKTPSSSKLPITKALLENVLSDINTKGFSLPVAKALPVAPRSQLDKTLNFLESPVSDMTEKSSVFETPVISMYGKEPDEIENTSSEHLTDVLSSASPMEGILSFSKDMPNDLQNFKSQSSSKLLITKALLENVLSDISAKGSSFPVAEALPVAPRSQLHKSLHFLESPVSDMTEKSSVIETPVISMYDREPDEIENTSSEHLTDVLSSASPMEGILSFSKDMPNDLQNFKTQSSSKLPITKALLENVLSDINTKGFSLPVAKALPVAPRSQLDKTLNFLEFPVSEMTEKSSVIETPVISMYDKEQDEIENLSSENLTDDLSSVSPMEGILSFSKDTSSDLSNIKTPSSSNLPITKALLENVLSDINTKGFSLPVAKALPVAPRSQLDKTLNFLESPVSDMTEKSSVIETQVISMYDREPDEIENPSSEHLTDDLSSVSPMEGIFSLSKDTPNDLSNIKTPSSSKLPITKALLENVLSDISTKGFSLPVAKALPVAPRSQLDKTLHFLESPVSDMTEKSSVIETPVISMYGKEPDEIENTSSEHLTDVLSSASPMEGILSFSKDMPNDLQNFKTQSSSKLPITKALLENVLSDINTKGFSLPVAKALPVAPRSQLDKTLNFLEFPVSEMTEKSSVIETPVISMYDKEQDEIENLSSENLTDDLSSVSPMEGILSFSKDTSSDLSNIKTPSSSNLPITKALLENVLSDINTKGFSLPVAKALPVAPRSQLDKTLNFLESPVSDMTEKSSVIETQVISMYDREPDEIENPSSEHLTDDLSSVSPMEGIFSLSKDTPNDLSNIKTPSSSKLPITKALLENVLLDISTKGFSLPVAKALPVAPRSQLDKTLNFLESPVSDMTENSSVIETPVISMYDREPDEIENPSSEHLTDDLSSVSPMEGFFTLSKDTPNDLPNFKTQSSSKLPITKALLENVLSDINTKGSKFPVAKAFPIASHSQLDKTLIFLESSVSDMTEKSSVIETPVISMYDREPDEIENPSSEHLTDDLSSVSPMEGFFTLSKDTPNDLPNFKTHSSSKLPITKALLENVLSDINTKGFSLPVAKALPVAPRSQLDKTLNFLEFPVTEMTEKGSVIEKPVISMYDKEQDEIENPSSENLTDFISSVSPMEGILSLSKDTPNDLPNFKTQSSSKLPITKALLENVLSDINTKGSLSPVAKALPVAPRLQLSYNALLSESSQFLI